MLLLSKWLLTAALFVTAAVAAPYYSFPYGDEQRVAPLLSSHTSEVITDSYIVVFNSDLDRSKIEYHHNYIRSFVEEENKKLAKRGLLEKLISGLKHTYNFKNWKGYSGRFSPEVLEKIRQSEEV